MHADVDLVGALDYKEHLADIARDATINPQVSVDLFSCIAAPGTPGLSCVDNIYDNYRYVLPYMTRNFEEEAYVKYLTVILQTDGLYDKEKACRVIPVWREFWKEECRIGALRVLTGFNYFRFTGKGDAYCGIVKKTITKGRRDFP